MNNNYLGVYDSGVGGLTVVEAIKKQLPNENIVFLADSKNMPYGSKSREQIISFSQNNIETLKRYGIKAVVVACNTSDSLASDIMRTIYDLPIIGVIKPAADKAYQLSESKNIAILATEATTKSKAYEKTLHKIDENINCFSIACPKLVPLIEQGDFNNKQLLETTDEYLSVVIDKVDTVILGCTHYDVLSDYIKNKYPKLNVVSSSRCVVQTLQDYMESNNICADKKEKEDIYLSTSDSSSFNEIASSIINGITIESI